LVNLIDPKEGTLILFTSVERMKRVLAKLPPSLSKMVLAQFSMPIKRLVESHKNWIDQGAGSILVGVDTLSEGMDLPGRYCTHVIVTQIPFPQLGTPLEETRSQDMGSTYFRRSLLPEAAKKLAQSVGRLLRRESDQGRVTLMDVRFRRHKYGMDLIKTLPGFKLVRL
jgi:ATP-dependent DNA helicase DinG